jgi:VanZ family protein
MAGMSLVSFYKTWFFRWGPAVIVMVAIFLFSSIPSTGLPSFGVYDLIAKKGGHLLGYALLAVAYLHGFGQANPGSYRNAFLLSVIYAASDEIHQSFVPGRGPWIVDIGIDGIGAAFGLAAAWFKQRDISPGHSRENR